MSIKTTAPKSPADVNLADVTVAGLSYPDSKKVDRRRGFCACCGRSGFLLNKEGRLSRHGFTRPRYWGVTVGECEGSGMKPQDTVAIAIRQIEHSIPKAERLLATDMVEFTIRMVRRTNREQYLSELRMDAEWGARRENRDARVKRNTGYRWSAAQVMKALRSYRLNGVPTEDLSYTSEGEAVSKIQRERRDMERNLASLRADLETLKQLLKDVVAAAA